MRMLPISAGSACFPCRAQLQEAIECMRKSWVPALLTCYAPSGKPPPLSALSENCHGSGTYHVLATGPSVFMISFHSDISPKRYLSKSSSALHAPCYPLLVEESGPGKLTEMGMKNMAGPCLARSGMRFWLPFVQHSLRLHHTHILLAQTPSTQGNLLPWGLRVPTGQTRLPARGLPRVCEGQVVGGPGEAPGRRGGLEKVLGGFQAPMGLASQPRPPWSHKGYCFGADSVWPRILHSPPWGTAGIQGRLAPQWDRVVSAEPSRSGHPTDS